MFSAHKYFKICFKYFRSIDRNDRKTFVCLCRQIKSRMHTIFNTVHAMPDMNNTYQIQDIWRIFMRVRVCPDGQTGRQTKCINTFQLCWKVLKSTRNKIMEDFWDECYFTMVLCIMIYASTKFIPDWQDFYPGKKICQNNNSFRL